MSSTLMCTLWKELPTRQASGVPTEPNMVHTIKVSRLPPPESLTLAGTVNKNIWGLGE